MFIESLSKIGPVGISVLGALGHVTGQLLIAWPVVIRHPSIWMLLPSFLLFALISGIVNGLAADYLLASLYKHPAFAGLEEKYAAAKSQTHRELQTYKSEEGT
ncbi:MAG: Gx transporter family protein [Desulfuromusa sp.]|nr:Gx transporter family protein [Desulfuromusa sp.]